ncbi:MAG: hypothetical protein HY902_15000 [Deltaproteobacteria bacterium]|nr:hypothetical protein [Deltaproteobacteria bacterium]
MNLRTTTRILLCGWALVAVGGGCQRGPAAPTAPVKATPPAAAVALAAAASATLAEPATPAGAPAEPTAGAPQEGPLLRTWLGGFQAGESVALVATTERAVVIQASGQGLRAAAIDSLGRPIWQNSASIAGGELAAPVRRLLAVRAGTRTWAGPQAGRVLAQWSAAGEATARRLPAPLAGLVGQDDGAAVVLLQRPEGARAARLHSEGGSAWEVAVALPGPVTATVGTLRGDALLLGRPPAGSRSGWWLARLAGGDGSLLWQRPIDAKQLPANAELFATAAAPGGMAILTAGLRPSDRGEPWSVVRVDANGAVTGVERVPRAAPEAELAGDASLLLLGQARDGGLWLDTWGARWQSRYRAPWLGIETPRALSHAGGSQLWAVSSVWTGGGGGDRLLLSRLGFAVGELHAGPCRASACTATWQTGSDCAELPARDGSPCGPGAMCTGGQCGGGVRPAPP